MSWDKIGDFLSGNELTKSVADLVVLMFVMIILTVDNIIVK